jgi:hypothetical protein
MSNVLIGIIGVILFIGLALAGALFLGPRFQESTNNSRASAAVQAVSQVASAANMYNVNEGLTAVDGVVTDASLITKGGYLKSVPANPTGGTGAPTIATITTGTAPNTVTSRYVTMALAGNAESICKAINKQTRGNENEIADATGTAGCTTKAGVYTAFSSI